LLILARDRIGLVPEPLRKLENTMSAARLYRLADKVVMTAITAALLVGVPVSAVAFVVQTL
jgi:hypothetical protein